MTKTILFIAAICLVLSISVCFTGCTKKNSDSTSKPIQTDSTKDSTSHAPPTTSESLLSYEQRQGKNIYSKYCTVCHGDDGKGDGFNAFNLDPKPRDFTDEKIMNSINDERLYRTISGGGRSVNKSPLMPSWGGRLQNDEINYLVTYVRSFVPPK
jgi:mono/diheme cytochrome c family protein